MYNVLYDFEITHENAFKRPKKNEKGKMVPIISDVMMETMLNNNRRIKYIALLVSLVLNLDYDDVLKEIKIIKNTIDRDTIIEAGKRLDCLYTYKDILIDIEVNDVGDKKRLNRNEEYIRNLFGRRKIGDDYIYNRVIQINIDNFSFVGMDDDTLHRYENVETILGRKLIMSKNFQTYHIYLPKIKKKFYNKEKLNRLELLMVVFNEKEDSYYLRELIKGESIMKEFREEALRISKEDKDVWLAIQKEIIDRDYQEAVKDDLRKEGLEKGKKEGIEKGRKEGIKEGKKEGIKEGRKEEKIAIIKNMLKENIDISTISKVTGLTEKEIEDIKNK